MGSRRGDKKTDSRRRTHTPTTTTITTFILFSFSPQLEREHLFMSFTCHLSPKEPVSLHNTHFYSKTSKEPWSEREKTSETAAVFSI
jgi:hypothetical protein